VILNPIEQSIKAKIEKVGTPLKDWDISINYGIKTGYNEAFIIDGSKREEILNNCRSSDERKRTDELIRPILRGRDIKRYSYEWAGLYIIATFPSLHIDIEKYPAVKKHLLSFGMERLEQTGKTYTKCGIKISARKKTNNKWFETQDQIGYWDDFSKPKIVWGEISNKANFALDENNHYFINNKCYLLAGEKLFFLTCYLNSHLSEYLFSKIATTTGVGTAQWSKFTIEQLYVPQINRNYEDTFNIMFLGLKKNEITEDAINRCIYDICNLSLSEVKFIENYSNSI